MSGLIITKVTIFCVFAFVSTANGFMFSFGQPVRRDFEPIEPDFRIREIRWRLAPNSLGGGRVVAEVAVSDHYDYELTWHMNVKKQLADGVFYNYLVPLSSTASHLVYYQRYWNDGDPILSAELILHSVPDTDPLELTLEISAVDFGPDMFYEVSLPRSTNPYAAEQFFTPDLPRTLAHPRTPVNYRPGQEVELEIRYTPGPPEHLLISEGTPTDDPTRLLHETSLPDDDPRVVTSTADNVTTVRLALGALDRQDKALYSIGFMEDDVFISVNLPVLPAGESSLFAGRPDLPMLLRSCDRESLVQETDDLVRFEFRRGTANCVRCFVASNDYVDVSMLRDNVPIGGGGSHAAYTSRVTPDVVMAVFIVYGESYQSYSFAGRYTCAAYRYDGAVAEREFEISYN